MDTNRELSDKELLSQLIAGDRFAYTTIYNRYKHLLFLFASKRLSDPQDAEDILAEVFLSLWTRHPELNQDQEIVPYLYNAVRYRIISLYAKQKVAARYLDSFNGYLSDMFSSEEADHLLRHNELSALIEKEISALPNKMREVFLLSRNSHLNRAQIANELNLSEQTVKSHMHHALKILKTKLGTMMVLVFF